MGGRSGRSVSGSPVSQVMRHLERAITRMKDPAVEKIAEEQQGNAFQVLIATMLSAQTKDAVTFKASTRLFKRAATPLALGRLSVQEIEQLIYPVSFYRNKARHLKDTSRQLLQHFDGCVPSAMGELLSLPGVGRKTANLVLIIAHNSKVNICVDTHVHRISNRLGWVCTKTPEQTEKELYVVSPRRWWASINLYLVTWGQNICRPVYPLCRQCAVSKLCPRLGVTRIGKSAVNH